MTFGEALDGVAHWPCCYTFKSKSCGYTGAESTCDHSPKRCKELGRLEVYSGFPAPKVSSVSGEYRR